MSKVISEKRKNELLEQLRNERKLRKAKILNYEPESVHHISQLESTSQLLNQNYSQQEQSQEEELDIQQLQNQQHTIPQYYQEDQDNNYQKQNININTEPDPILEIQEIYTKPDIEKNLQIINNFYKKCEQIRLGDQYGKQEKDIIYQRIKNKYRRQSDVDQTQSPEVDQYFKGVKKNVFHERCLHQVKQKQNQINPKLISSLSPSQRHQMWNKLQQNKTEEIQRREFVKNQQYNNYIQKECTFSPYISPNSQKIAMIQRPDMPIERKLNIIGEQSKKIREIQKSQKDEFEANQCSFRPQLNEKSQMINEIQQRKPLTERYIDIQKNKEQRRKEKIQEQEEYYQSSYFKPYISDTSNFLAKIRQKPHDFSDDEQEEQLGDQILRKYKEENSENNQNDEEYEEDLESDQYYQQNSATFMSKSIPNPKQVIKRLENEAKYIQQKKQQLYHKYDNIENQNCTFQPNNQITEKQNYKLLSQIPLFQQDITFEQRQEILQQFYDQKKQNRSQFIKEEECPFQPKIDQISEMLANADDDYNQMNVEGRLLQKNNEKKTKLQRKQMEKENEYKFQPQINKVSELLTEGRENSLNRLAYNYEGQMKKAQFKKDKELDNCSFYPSTCATSKYVTTTQSSYQQLDQIQNNINANKYEKNQRIEKIKKQKEKDEMKECTFKPKINKKQNQMFNSMEFQPKKERQSSSNVKVRGMENYLRNRDQVTKKKMQKKVVEKNLYDYGRKYENRVKERPGEKDFISQNRSMAGKTQNKSQNNISLKHFR